MIWVLLFSGLNVAACVAYHLRARRFVAEARQALAGADQPLAGAALAMLKVVVKSGLPPSGTGGGLRALPVVFREAQDSYTTLYELLERIARTSKDDKPQELLELAKLIYQLQYSLELPVSTCDPFLEAMQDRLGTAAGGIGIGRIARIAPGDPVDPKTCMPLNFGTHVAAPFGVVVYDRGGKILQKAKVLCR